MKKKCLLFILCCFSLMILNACGGKENDVEESYGNETEGAYWSIQTTVDDFGDETYESELTLVAPINGTFSNTATASSELSGDVYIAPFTKGSNIISVYFDLLEYGNSPITYTTSEADNILLKTKVNGVVQEYNLIGMQSNRMLMLYGDIESDFKDGNKFYYSLVDGYDIPCIITIGNSKYNFTVESQNIKSAYNTAYASADEIDLSIVTNLVDITNRIEPKKKVEYELDAYSDRLEIGEVSYADKAYFVKMEDKDGNDGYLGQDKIVLIYKISVKFKKQDDIDKIGTDKTTYYCTISYGGIQKQQTEFGTAPEISMLFEAGGGKYITEDSMIDEAVKYQFEERSKEGYNNYYDCNIQYIVSEFK